MHAVEEAKEKLDQIIVIGDMPWNLPVNIEEKQKTKHGIEYWAKHLPGI